LGNRATTWATWSGYRADEIPTTSLPAGGDSPCALFFPADYSVGMANLGFHYIYRALRELGVAAERFFASPAPHRSVERDTLLERFQVILSGISYEADARVLVKWLESAGIPPSRTERASRGGAPLIGCGGAVTYINPCLLSAIADFVVLGDGVGVVPHVVEVVRSQRLRDRVLSLLAEHPSIYVPAIHESGVHLLETSRRGIDLDFGHGNWVTPRTVFGAAFLVELQRGCARGCGFCTLPACFSPPRQRDLDLVKRDIDEAARGSELGRIGLVTPEAGDYKDLDELLDFAGERGMGISFASLRLDGMTQKMVRALVRGGRRSVTVAPESGDDRLRARCGKSFTNDLIVETLRMAKGEGVRSAKLYFMMGLPGEEDHHLLSISNLCLRVRESTGLRVTATIAPFVPKPGTRWADAPFGGEGEGNALKKLKRGRDVLLKSFHGSLRGIAEIASIKEACLEYALSWATPETSRRLVDGAPLGFSYNRLLYEVSRPEAASELRRLGLTRDIAKLK
jgi:radical SAM superfamily enzyme YgiQ (UPF0313 family)